MDNYEDLANEYNQHVDMLKTNSSFLKQTGLSLVKSAECMDEMVKMYTNPFSFVMPGGIDRLKELEKKANSYIIVAGSNISQLSKIIDDIANKNKDENNDGV